MSRPKLPPHARRVQVSLTLSSAALAILDAFVAAGQAATRSAAAETAIMAWFAAAPRPGDATNEKRPRAAKRQPGA